MRNKLLIPFCLISVVVICLAFLYSQKHTSAPVPQADGENVVEYKIGASDVAFDDSYKEKMSLFNKDLADYYNTHRYENGIITEYGTMFDMFRDAEVTVKDVINEYGTDISEDIINNTELLLLRTEDVAKVLERSEQGKELVPFTAFNTKDGYYISSDGFEGEVIDAEKFKALRLMYSFSHGNVVNPKKGSEDYNAIMQAVAFPSPYDVKHIAHDDRYAVVVVGSLEDTSDIREYALTNNGSKWTVIKKDMEKDGNSKQEINNMCPDMELGLLPVYNIANYAQIYSSEDLKDIADAVRASVSDEDKIDGDYVCGAYPFVYMEFNATGKRFIGFRDGKDEPVHFEPCADLATVIAYMKQKDDDPPVFICKFNN